MILEFNNTIALRCNKCSQSFTSNTNVFMFSNNKRITINCICGESCLEIRHSKDKYVMQVVCPFCTSPHIYRISSKTFWMSSMTTLNCPSTSLPILLIGNKDKVENKLRECDMQLDNMLDELEYSELTDSLVDNSIMIKTLEKIQMLSESGCLKCSCKSDDISFTINKGAITLFCDHCNASQIILARTDTDLKKLENQNSITIGANNTNGNK